eukprot:scaffold1954_cov268-Pinguiococcus_pyrenoidosus.AAC.316
MTHARTPIRACYAQPRRVRAAGRSFPTFAGAARGASTTEGRAARIHLQIAAGLPQLTSKWRPMPCAGTSGTGECIATDRAFDATRNSALPRPRSFKQPEAPRLVAPLRGTRRGSTRDCTRVPLPPLPAWQEVARSVALRRLNRPPGGQRAFGARGAVLCNRAASAAVGPR